MFKFKKEEKIYNDGTIENTIQAWIEKGILKESCKKFNIKKKHRLVNEYIISGKCKGEGVIFDDEAGDHIIKNRIKDGAFDESYINLDIKEKSRLLDEYEKNENRKSGEYHKMREEDEEARKLIKETQKETNLEGSNSNYILGKKYHLFKQEVERIEHDSKIRQENEKKGIPDSAPEIIWKEFYKDKTPKERYCLLKEQLDRLISETNARRQKKRESMLKREQEINFRLQMMDKEGVWYGPSAEDEERIIAEMNAYHKAEREFEIKKAGIIAEMEEIVLADKLKKKHIDEKLQ